MAERKTYRVRHYDGFDCVWMDVSDLGTLQKAIDVWLKKTTNGTEKTSFGDIDYYSIWDENAIVDPALWHHKMASVRENFLATANAKAGTVKPALTPEEWAQSRQSQAGEHNKAPMIHGQFLVFSGMPEPINRLHAMAALCLHEQPFGFTREDVDGLRIMMDREGPRIHLYGSVASLADRIEALLPPEDT